MRRPHPDLVERVPRKTVSSYSPMRTDPMIERRVAWRPLEDAMSLENVRKNYSFGRDPYSIDDWEREREYRATLARRDGRGSPLRADNRSKSGNKNVSFA